MYEKPKKKSLRVVLNRHAHPVDQVWANRDDVDLPNPDNEELINREYKLVLYYLGKLLHDIPEKTKDLWHFDIAERYTTAQYYSSPTELWLIL